MQITEAGTSNRRVAQVQPGPGHPRRVGHGSPAESVEVGVCQTLDAAALVHEVVPGRQLDVGHDVRVEDDPALQWTAVDVTRPDGSDQVGGR